jgi:hypothetical protein
MPRMDNLPNTALAMHGLIGIARFHVDRMIGGFWRSIAI